MEYLLEECSAYRSKIIKNTPIFIFDSHNMALPVWGTIRQKSRAALHLISFDTHADTRAAFTRAIYGEYFIYDKFTFDKFKKKILSSYHCDAKDFIFKDVFYLAIELVAHDEQIMVAEYYNYINRYTLFCDLDEDEALEYQMTDRRQRLAATYYTKHKILEMSATDLSSLCQEPFILDFDLDYFTHSDIITNETFQNKVCLLIKSAVAITIAREEECFNLKKVDENFSNNQALQMLLNFIEQKLIEE